MYFCISSNIFKKNPISSLNLFFLSHPCQYVKSWILQLASTNTILSRRSIEWSIHRINLSRRELPCHPHQFMTQFWVKKTMSSGVKSFHDIVLYFSRVSILCKMPYLFRWWHERSFYWWMYFHSFFTSWKWFRCEFFRHFYSLVQIYWVSSIVMSLSIFLFKK